MSKKMNEALAKISNGASDSYWIEHVKYVVENRAWLKKSAIIAMRVLDALDAQKLSQKEVAERMGVSPQQISKIVKGHENLTLETITKLEAALSVQLILETANSNEWAEKDTEKEDEWVVREKKGEWVRNKKNSNEDDKVDDVK